MQKQSKTEKGHKSLETPKVNSPRNARRIERKGIHRMLLSFHALYRPIKPHDKGRIRPTHV
jgi:hypothetical protein